MTKSEATEIIKASAARGSRTPCTWRDDREAYLAEQTSMLLEAVIDPVEVVVVSEAFNYGALQNLKGSSVLGIAKSADQWLLYASKTESFLKAVGEEPDSLEILGFSSDDALAEWLG